MTFASNRIQRSDKERDISPVIDYGIYERPVTYNLTGFYYPLVRHRRLHICDSGCFGAFRVNLNVGLMYDLGKAYTHGAILQEVPLQYKYAIGDTVYTSGHSLMFPPDIPLGVAGDARVINGATNEIKVDLFQDFTAIRYVTVVHNTAFDEVEEFDL